MMVEAVCVVACVWLDLEVALQNLPNQKAEEEQANLF